jgi:hypothetical protein
VANLVNIAETGSAIGRRMPGVVDGDLAEA